MAGSKGGSAKQREAAVIEQHTVKMNRAGEKDPGVTRAAIQVEAGMTEQQMQEMMQNALRRIAILEENLARLVSEKEASLEEEAEFPSVTTATENSIKVFTLTSVNNGNGKHAEAVWVLNTHPDEQWLAQDECLGLAEEIGVEDGEPEWSDFEELEFGEFYATRDFGYSEDDFMVFPDTPALDGRLHETLSIPDKYQDQETIVDGVTSEPIEKIFHGIQADVGLITAEQHTQKVIQQSRSLDKGLETQIEINLPIPPPHRITKGHMNSPE